MTRPPSSQTSPTTRQRRRSRLWKALAATTLVGTSLALSFAGLRSAEAQSPASVRWSTVEWHDTSAQARRGNGALVDLTLDPELHRGTTTLLQRARAIAAGAVMLEVESGSILAMSEVGQDRGHLLFDAVAPAASVFKIITTAALLDRASVNPSLEVCTKGGLRGIRREHLEPARGKGTICSPFAQALGHSRNAVYAQLATHRLLHDDLAEVAETWGFNSTVAADVDARFGSLEVPYGDLEFARTAAGFRNSRLSVLGAAQLAYTVASGGVIRPMHVIKSSEEASSPNPSGATSEEPRRVLSPAQARRLVRMMETTVHSGTSLDAFSDERGHNYLGSIRAAGKTGTLKPGKDRPTSSWFIGFAPSRKPEVVVAVLLQNPDLWHRKGNEVGRDLLRLYFSHRGAKGVTSPL